MFCRPTIDFPNSRVMRLTPSCCSCCGRWELRFSLAQGESAAHAVERGKCTWMKVRVLGRHSPQVPAVPVC